jgi:peroxiredoxin
MDEKPDDGKVFLDAHKASFAVASGANAACAKAFAVKAMPSTYLIDRSGNLRETHQGFRPSEAVSLRNSVVKLLSESP